MGDVPFRERRHVQSISDLISNRFGAKTTYRQSAAGFVVNIAVTQIFSNNPKRFGMVIVNISDNRIYISPDPHPFTDHGWLLVPNGGSIHFNWIDDFQLCTLSMYGHAIADNSDCYFLEVFCV